LTAEVKAQRDGEPRDDLLASLPGIEARHVDAGDPHTTGDRALRPGRRRKRDGCGQNEHEREQSALPERHADERGGGSLHWLE